MLLAAGCTAFYMFRLYFLVFEGEYRGSLVTDGGHGHDTHGNEATNARARRPRPRCARPRRTARVAAGDDGGAVDPRRSARCSSASSASPTSSAQGHDSVRRVALAGPAAAGARRDAAASSCIFAAIATRRRRCVGIGLAWLLYGDGVSPRVKQLRGRVPAALQARSSTSTTSTRSTTSSSCARSAARAFVLWKAFDTFVIDLVFVNGVGFVVSGFGKLVEVPAERRPPALHRRRSSSAAPAIIGVGTHYDVLGAAEVRRSHASGRDVQVIAHGAGPTAQAAAVPRRLGRRRQVLRRPQIDARPSSHTYDIGRARTEITVEAIDPRWDIGRAA